MTCLYACAYYAELGTHAPGCPTCSGPSSSDALSTVATPRDGGPVFESRSAAVLTVLLALVVACVVIGWLAVSL